MVVSFGAVEFFGRPDARGIQEADGLNGFRMKADAEIVERRLGPVVL
jgi:hypothetical protein